MISMPGIIIYERNAMRVPVRACGEVLTFRAAPTLRTHFITFFRKGRILESPSIALT